MTDAYIKHVLDLCGGDRHVAAGRLGITERTLYNRLGAPLKYKNEAKRRQPKGRV